MSDGRTYRRMDVSVKLDIWSWPDGTLSVHDKDITSSILNYRWQKTIKNPQGSCQINIVPQVDDKNIIDVVHPMDIVKIYEFGQLKFIGFVQRVAYSGSIQGEQGKPNRSSTITCQQFGGLLVTASIGIGLGTALRTQTGEPADDPLREQAIRLPIAIGNAVTDGASYAELVGVVYANFRDYITALGATNFLQYLDQYLDVGVGLSSNETPLIPRTFQLYTGLEESLTFWQLVEQLVQKPFNELWIDSGPRTVDIDGQRVVLPSKSCLVFRPTPFNGTVTGTTGDDGGSAFDSLPEVEIPRGYSLGFNLSRSMDEVYTFYSVKQAAFQFTDLIRQLSGIANIDNDRVGKYLFRPLITELFYTRSESLVDGKLQLTNQQAEDVSKNASLTLLNWFKNNDEFLSGTITHMVPDERIGITDPRIGDKVTAYGIDGFFYVEGVSHTWVYGGALKSDLTVTRGFNRKQSIKLTDKIFRRNRLT